VVKWSKSKSEFLDPGLSVNMVCMAVTTPSITCTKRMQIWFYYMHIMDVGNKLWQVLKVMGTC